VGGDPRGFQMRVLVGYMGKKEGRKERGRIERQRGGEWGREKEKGPLKNRRLQSRGEEKKCIKRIAELGKKASRKLWQGGKEGPLSTRGSGEKSPVGVTTPGSKINETPGRKSAKREVPGKSGGLVVVVSKAESLTKNAAEAHVKDSHHGGKKVVRWSLVGEEKEGWGTCQM